MRTSQGWQEVFKSVLGDVDVVLEILDSRNPIGTHNRMVEEFIQKHRPGEINLLLVLNKIDMVPSEVSRAWIAYFRSKNYLIIPVAAKFKRGTEILFHKIRMNAKRDPAHCLIVGYPNTGKSTLIEALTHDKKVIGTSPLAGFTRSIRKVKLNNHLFLIDTPGVIPIDEKNETDMAIKACITADKLEDPMAVVESIFRLLSKDQFRQLYNIDLTDDDGPDELIEKVGRKLGRIIKGGIVNETEVQKTIIRDWQANRLRYYMLPPDWKGEDHPVSLPAEDDLPEESPSTKK